MNNNDQIHQVELSMEYAVKTIKRKETFQKLAESSSFKEIIEEGYFTNEASRLVLLRADPNMQDEASQKSVDAQISAIGHLRQYFIGLNAMGTQAENALAADQDTHAELLAEA